MRIAFTHNLKIADTEAEAEFDTPETVRAITEILQSLGHDVHPVEVSGPASRLVARLETLRPDLVFNTAEGSHGRYREAFYPALFEQLRIPFTGSGPYVCGVTLDKQATKLLLRQAGVPTPRWAFFDADRPLTDMPDLRFPVIVKPNFEGSSKGVTADGIVGDPERLRAVLEPMLQRYGNGVLVEEFIVGADVTVPYLESVGVLSPAAYRLEVEGVADGFAIYDYALKNHHPERVHVDVPAELPPEVEAALRKHTATVMRELDIRDFGRADFRVTESGEVYFIEVNALPSLEPGASLYVSSAYSGLESEREVLDAIITSAATRQQIVEHPPRLPDALRVGLAHNVRRVDPRTDDADAEFDAPTTIAAIVAAIESLGHEVVPIEATPELPRIVGDLDLDVVFNIAEGIRGRSREAQVPALLDLLGIEYTGSDTATLAVALDKGLAKRLVREAGVATARWVTVPPGAKAPENLRFPMIVKPNAEGSSKGVTSASVARDHAELAAAVSKVHQKYATPALVEEFLPGREFTVGILGELEPRVLPVMEIVFGGDSDLPIYSFAHKTDEDSSVSFVVPADTDEALGAQIRQVALDSFFALGCRDVARIDIRLDHEGKPNFVECNPLPGLSPGFSDLCVIAQAAGMDHASLVAAILSPAVGRYQAAREAPRVG